MSSKKTLYNGLISGVGLDGKSFFYTNAMQVSNGFSFGDLERTRSGWFTCSCCPTNLVRLLPSIPGYIYAQNGDNVYVNLFISSIANLKVNNKGLTITQQNNYPWDGGLSFTIDPAAATQMNLLIRIPGWARNQAMPSDLYTYEAPSAQPIEIKVNGIAVRYEVQKGYAVISKKWKKGDKVELTLPMNVQRVIANNHLADDTNKVALQRGPVMYCAEWKDNDGKAANIIVPKNAEFETAFEPALLNGVLVIKAKVKSVNIDPATQDVSTNSKTMTAIPYYAWANRGDGEMTVWFPEQVKDIALLTR
jgi:uncharacterized protein